MWEHMQTSTRTGEPLVQEWTGVKMFPAGHIASDLECNAVTTAPNTSGAPYATITTLGVFMNRLPLLIHLNPHNFTTRELGFIVISQLSKQRFRTSKMLK